MPEQDAFEALMQHFTVYLYGVLSYGCPGRLCRDDILQRASCRAPSPQMLSRPSLQQHAHKCSLLKQNGARISLQY